MKVLHSKPISLRKEVNQLLEAENKNINDFKGLMDFLIRLEQSRKELRLDEENWVNNFNAKTTIAHDKMEVYLRILLNLNMYLSIPNLKGKSILNFQYKSHIGKAWVRNNSFYFESIISFYNYAVLYFNSGYELIQSASNQGDAKQGLNSFRIAFWGFQEVYQGRKFCVSTGRMPGEISNDNLEIMMALCVSFGYLCMCRAMGMSLGSLASSDRCRLYCAVSKHLMHAESLLGKVADKHFRNKELLQSHVYWYKNLYYCKCFYEMAEDYRVKHEEKVTGGFIGWQLGYLYALEECFSNLMTADKTMLATQKDLIEAVKEVLKKKQMVELENKEVYKIKVPSKKELLLEEPKSKLKSLNRPNCKTIMPELKNIFSNKKSREFNRIIADLDVLVNTNRNNLFGLIDNICKKKNYIYQDLKIDTLLSTVSSESSNKVKQKLSEINNDFGGYMGYMQLTNNLQQLSTKNDEMARSIMTQMQKDRDADFAFQRATGIKIPSLKESNPDLVKQFEKHGVGLTALKKKDRELIADFEHCSETLRQAEGESYKRELDNLAEGIGQIDGADTLVKMDKVVTQWFNGRVLAKKEEILQYYNSLDYEEMVVNIFMIKYSEEQTYLDLNDKLDSRTLEIQEHIEKQHIVLNKIAETAKKVNDQVSQHRGTLEKKQKLVSEINSASLLYSMLLNNIELHTNFEKALTLINQSVGDYLQSKNLQKQEMQGGGNQSSNQGPGGNQQAGYFGQPTPDMPPGQQGKPGGEKGVSAFLSDILKEQGFDFKF